MAPDNHLIELANLLSDLDFFWKFMDDFVHVFVHVFVVLKLACSVDGFARLCGRLWREIVCYAEDGAGVCRWEAEGGAVQVAAAEMDVLCACVGSALRLWIVALGRVLQKAIGSSCIRSSLRVVQILGSLFKRVEGRVGECWVPFSSVVGDQ